jgi:hypothetical protein
MGILNANLLNVDLTVTTIMASLIPSRLLLDLLDRLTTCHASARQVDRR